MTLTEIVRHEIDELEKEQRRFEIDFHRIAGALVAYKKVLEALDQAQAPLPPHPDSGVSTETDK